MLKDIQITLTNGSMAEFLSVVGLKTDHGEFVILKEKSGIEHHINKQMLALMSIKSSVDMNPAKVII